MFVVDVVLMRDEWSWILCCREAKWVPVCSNAAFGNSVSQLSRRCCERVSSLRICPLDEWIQNESVCSLFCTQEWFLLDYEGVFSSPVLVPRKAVFNYIMLFVSLQLPDDPSVVMV